MELSSQSFVDSQKSVSSVNLSKMKGETVFCFVRKIKGVLCSYTWPVSHLRLGGGLHRYVCRIFRLEKMYLLGEAVILKF